MTSAQSERPVGILSDGLELPTVALARTGSPAVSISTGDGAYAPVVVDAAGRRPMMGVPSRRGPAPLVTSRGYIFTEGV